MSDANIQFTEERPSGELARAMPPKSLMRILRVQRVLRLAATEVASDWTAIASSAGYYDQSHFIREFKELVGVLPSQYARLEATLTKSFADSASANIAG